MECMNSMMKNADKRLVTSEYAYGADHELPGLVGKNLHDPGDARLRDVLGPRWLLGGSSAVSLHD